MTRLSAAGPQKPLPRLNNFNLLLECKILQKSEIVNGMTNGPRSICPGMGEMTLKFQVFRL